jgi:hypothetical protein
MDLFILCCCLCLIICVVLGILVYSGNISIPNIGTSSLSGTIANVTSSAITGLTSGIISAVGGSTTQLLIGAGCNFNTDCKNSGTGKGQMSCCSSKQNYPFGALSVTSPSGHKGTCQYVSIDWAGVGYCPETCVGKSGGTAGSCWSSSSCTGCIPTSWIQGAPVNGTCTVGADCQNYGTTVGNVGCCNGKCQTLISDYLNDKTGWCPSVAKNGISDAAGSAGPSGCQAISLSSAVLISQYGVNSGVPDYKGVVCGSKGYHYPRLYNEPCTGADICAYGDCIRGICPNYKGNGQGEVCTIPSDCYYGNCIQYPTGKGTCAGKGGNTISGVCVLPTDCQNPNKNVSCCNNVCQNLYKDYIGTCWCKNVCKKSLTASSGTCTSVC